MRFSRQEYWSALPCPPPGDHPNPGIKPRSPASSALQAVSLALSPREAPYIHPLPLEAPSHPYPHPTSVVTKPWFEFSESPIWFTSSVVHVSMLLSPFAPPSPPAPTVHGSVLYVCLNCRPANWLNSIVFLDSIYIYALLIHEILFK